MCGVRVRGGSCPDLDVMVAQLAPEGERDEGRVPVRLQKMLVKALVSIGGGLSQVKELRDLFEDVLADVVDPLRRARVRVVPALRLMNRMATVWPEKDTILFDAYWVRYMRVMALITAKLLKTLL